jgi:glycosyltransferase involved in cell wall biosynthesis
MRKVLFITYFWPPSGKASLHWPLKIIRYLPDSNWKPLVLTVDEETFTQKDESLLKEIPPKLKICKAKSFEPFNIYRKLIGKQREEPLVASETISLENNNVLHRISIWIRMNLFIPDARIGWYPSAVKEGRKIITHDKPDAIITIGPPHSTHLVGLKLSKEFQIAHIPVLIDPWVDIIYYKDFQRNYITRSIDNYLEKRVLDNSFKTVFVTKSTREDFIKKYPSLKTKSEVLYWGYDEEAFSNLKSYTNPESEVIVHAGNIFDYQNPELLWKKIKALISKGRRIKIKFIGTVSPGVKSSIKNYGLEPYTEFAGFLSYTEMIGELLKASYLLVCATEKRHVPGKLFEYLRAGKPIIAFGEENDEVKEILRLSNAGMMFGYSQNTSEFWESLDSFKTNFEFIIKFDRRRITHKLSLILDSIQSH